MFADEPHTASAASASTTNLQQDSPSHLTLVSLVILCDKSDGWKIEEDINQAASLASFRRLAQLRVMLLYEVCQVIGRAMATVFLFRYLH
jgi:hypothetical protein